MKSAHKVKAYRNNTDTADKAAFLGSYLTKDTIAIEKLCEQIAVQSGLTAIQVRAILEGSFDAIAELEKEGLVIVHLDGLTVMAVITGSFPTSDAPFDGERNALELAIRLDDDIRLAFVNETAQMVTDAAMARVRIDSVMDLETRRPMNIIHGQKQFRVAGFNIVLDDEGAEVYLQNSIGVTFPVVVDEVTSTQLFTAHVAAAVEPGDYRLVVKSRGGDPEGVLQTTFRKVKYLGVASTGPVIRYAYSAGHEDDRSTIFYDEANSLHIVGERLSGAAVKVTYIDSDGDMIIDVPVHKIFETDIGIAIDGDWLAETLPSNLSADMTFSVTTADGSDSVVLTHE